MAARRFGSPFSARTPRRAVGPRWRGGNAAGVAALPEPAPRPVPSATHHPPSATRPEGYPEALPWVPGAAVSVTAVRPGMTHGPAAQWWTAESPDGLFEHLLRSSLEDGWTLSTDEATPPLSARVASLRRDGRARTILAARLGAAGMVTLADRDAG